MKDMEIAMEFNPPTEMKNGNVRISASFKYPVEGSLRASSPAAIGASAGAAVSALVASPLFQRSLTRFLLAKFEIDEEPETGKKVLPQPGQPGWEPKSKDSPPPADAKKRTNAAMKKQAKTTRMPPIDPEALQKAKALGIEIKDLIMLDPSGDDGEITVLDVERYQRRKDAFSG